MPISFKLVVPAGEGLVGRQQEGRVFRMPGR